MEMFQAPQDQTESKEITVEVSAVPEVTIRTIIDGREESLSEYLCDWPDCPNVAVEVLGIVRELRLRAVVCAEHAHLANRGRKDSGR